jgi:hypothetical protein
MKTDRQVERLCAKIDKLEAERAKLFMLVVKLEKAGDAMADAAPITDGVEWRKLRGGGG